jgi:hypothetical protein
MYTGGLVACIGSAMVGGGAWIFLLVILGSLFLWRVGEKQADDTAISERVPRLQETDKSIDPVRVVTKTARKTVPFQSPI